MVVLFSSSAFAVVQDDEAKLVSHMQKDYGRDLTQVPFFLKFSYYKQFDKEWGETDYLQRKVFLEKYEKETAAEKAKTKAELEAEAIKERAILQAKMNEQRKKRDRLKAELAKEKAEKREDAQRQREFDDALKEQKRELKLMQQLATPHN